METAEIEPSGRAELGEAIVHTGQLTSEIVAGRDALCGGGVVSLSPPITRVVVFEDRAQITREIRLELSAGSHRIEISEISPLAVDHTVQVQLLQGAGLVGDCRVRREAVERHFPDAEQEALRQEQEALQQQLAAEEDTRTRLHRRLELLERLTGDLRTRCEAAVARGVSPEPFLERIARTFQEQEALQASLHDLSLTSARLQDQLRRIQERQSTAQSPERIARARIETHLEVSSGGFIRLAIRYVVPCALWRPEHLARLELRDGEPVVTLATRAVIWQATLEDWTDVELVVSTARPGRVSTPPLLEDELLQARKKSDAERREIVADVRDEEIQTTGLGTGASASGMPGVDDGGEALSWRVSQPVTIPARGRPMRAPLFAWESVALVSSVCFPERLPQVLTRAELTNEGGRPVLAGPVVLYREGDYVGRSQVRFIAAGERFALSFGSLDGVLVARDSRIERETSRLTGHQTLTFTVTHAFSNLSSSRQSVRVTERIPVSELEDVKIHLGDRIPARPDKDGLLTWTEGLEPRAQLSRELTYRLEAPGKVRLPF